MDAPRTRYTRLGSAHIAYQVLGDGPPLLLLLGVSTHVEAMWEEPALARFLRRLASFSQLILHDRRGSGLSDPIADLSDLGMFCEDAMAVLRACGAGGTVVVGANEASLVALPLAARVPEQVRAVAVINGTARLMEAEDYPIGVPWRRGRRYITAGTTAYADQPMGLEFSAPSKLGDPAFADWAQRYQRLAASPGSLKRVAALIGEADARALLPSISQPALVVHRAGNRFIRLDHAHFMVEHLPNPRLIVLAGADHLVWVGPDTDRIATEIEELVTGTPARPSASASGHETGADSMIVAGKSDADLDETGESLTGTIHAAATDRVVATVLFTDIVGSTQCAARLGDRAWRALLDAHDAVVRRQLERFRGREVNTIGDGFVATFDGPGRAVQCACAIRDAVKALEIEVRVGLHTGEIEMRGDDVAGIAVHLAQRVSGAAGAGEVLVTRTVSDLVAGSGIQFADRGEQALKGIPGTWHLYSVVA